MDSLKWLVSSESGAQLKFFLVEVANFVMRTLIKQILFCLVSV